MKCKLKFALLFLCVAFNLTTLVSSECAEHFFDCKNGKCIANFFHCDEDNDCGNFEDEIDCFDHSSTEAANQTFRIFERACPDDHFACNDSFSTCLPKRWVCDGMKECSNGADELDCTLDKVDCGEDFKCDDLECVPSTWRCDNIHDCKDGSDEKNCTSFSTSLVGFCDKEHGLFQCHTGECIPYSKVCDKVTDCLMGDDEGLVCHVAQCHEKKCSHLCMFNPVTNSSECFCPPGYTILNDTCHDFDECAENRISNMCSQKCINLEGSHRCDCFEDYQMVNSTCIVKGQAPILYYSTGREIRALDLRNQTIFPVVETRDQEIIVGMDFDPIRKKLVYIGSGEKSHGAVYDVPIDDDRQLKTKVEVLFHENLKGIEGIAIDWLAGHFYITESANNKIVVCNFDSVNCATLKNNLSSPRGILVVPPMGKLYWTEWGQQPAIYESAMDGSGSALLIGGLNWPNDLALDEELNRLYWCDGHDGTIEYYDLEAKVRHVVFKDHRRQPYSLFVFEDYLYWSDWATNTIEVCNKISGHFMKPLVMDPVDRFFGLSVYHPKLQASSSRPNFNMCSKSQCSHLCLLTTKALSYSCACPDHMTLSSDGHTCRSKPEDPFLLVSTGHKVLKYYLNSISNTHTDELQILPIFNIDEVAFNFDRDELYIHDTYKNRIGLLDLKKKGHLQWKLLVDTDLRGVMSLAFDGNSDNLYWVDMIKGTLEVTSTRGHGRAVLNDKLTKPISLALSPQNRKLFVGLRSTPAEIVSLNMDGSSKRTLIMSPNGLPLALATDGANQLLWGDPVLQKIDSIDVTSVGQPKKLISANIEAINSIAIASGTVFWTTIDSPAFFYSSLQSSGNRSIQKRRLTDSNVNLDLLKIIVGTKQPRLYDFCQEGKHLCNHLCLIGSTGPICKCADGFVTQDNGLTCTKATISTAPKKAVSIGSSFDLARFFDSFSINWRKTETSDDTWKASSDSKSNESILAKNNSINTPTTGPTNDTVRTLPLNEDLPKELPKDVQVRQSFGVASLLMKIFFFILLSALAILLYFLWKDPSLRSRLTDQVYQIRPKEKTIRFVKNPRYEPDYLSSIDTKTADDKPAITMGHNNN